MKKLLIILTIILSSCYKEQYYTKPFIIIWKSDECENKITIYEFQDKDNKIREFSDSCGKYNIGDVIN